MGLGKRGGTSPPATHRERWPPFWTTERTDGDAVGERDLHDVDGLLRLVPATETPPPTDLRATGSSLTEGERDAPAS